ncbi:MAG TPA: T3SS effector HopA1 family protein [Terriglobia bacterium]|nr:T3SS effector HopA1 family protein [Terriglobia bacterium]
MENLQDEISRILSALAIHSPVAFSFGGLTMPVAPAADGAGWPNLSQHPMPAALQSCFYQYCFCSRFNGIVAPQAAPASAGDDMSQELSVANAGQPRWEPGWQIYKVEPSAQIFAQRGGVNRAFQPGQYVIQDGASAGPRAGSSATVFFPKESLTMQPGFYFAFGEAETDSPADYNLVRFYWNVKSEGAADLMRLSTERLNRFRIPFRMKSLTTRSQYTRLDAAIVYLNKRYFHIAAELLGGVRREMEGRLGEGVPLFTLRLAPGLALAEDPGNGESFGMNRCRMLAEAVWSAYLQGDQSLSGRLAAIASQFKANGLDLDRPYLNAGSADQYSPALFEAARA